MGQAFLLSDVGQASTRSVHARRFRLRRVSCREVMDPTGNSRPTGLPRKGEAAETGGIVTVSVECLPMWDETNGFVREVTKCGVDGICQ